MSEIERKSGILHNLGRVDNSLKTIDQEVAVLDESTRELKQALADIDNEIADLMRVYEQIGVLAFQNFPKAIMNAVREWVRAGQFTYPSRDDNMLFIAEEVGEAIQAYQRMKSGFVRNNPQTATSDELAEELADVVIMCAIMFDNIGKDMNSEVFDKLSKMSKKRGL